MQNKNVKEINSIVQSLFGEQIESNVQKNFIYKKLLSCIVFFIEKSLMHMIKNGLYNKLDKNIVLNFNNLFYNIMQKENGFNIIQNEKINSYLTLKDDRIEFNFDLISQIIDRVEKNILAKFNILFNNNKVSSLEIFTKNKNIDIKITLHKI